ncbi:MAG TPA: DNA recombination protein RmuC [Bacteroidia bacterium]|nr:DNA recombination protein RmuC [Bacteroidia bacterium]HNU32966.1 DNA recombination protein RmuC [Bacteroidia bacterium]
MEIVFLIAGAVLGGIIAWLIKSKSSLPAYITLESYTQLDKQKSIAEDALKKAADDYRKTDSLLTTEREKVNTYSIQNSRLSTELTNLNQKLLEQKQEVNDLQQKFQKEFENLANKILEEKSQKFTEQNRNNLDVILNPLKEKIKDFEEKVEKTYKAESTERISLKEQIKNLLDLNKQLSTDANNLATALKGDNKMQGNWGELVLEKILESSGLIKDHEYKTQVVTTNVDGEKIKPDVVVFLPDQKHLIIDSKVSLVAYNGYVATAEDEQRERFSKQHVDSVRSHIKLLSDKNYQTAAGYHSPDFVLLFMPMESAFSLALQADADLYNFAWDRKIVIVSPTTLLATLRTIASIWKQERQVKNALLIAEEGGKMYDKLHAFVEDLTNVGKKMDSAKADYTEAMKKLYEGTGNLVNRAQKMKDLGAKATKSLPPTLVERANEVSSD